MAKKNKPDPEAQASESSEKESSSSATSSKETKRSRSMRETLRAYIKSGKAGIYVQSFEEVRVEADIKALAQELSFRLNTWSVTSGARCMSDNPPTEFADTEEPIAMLKTFDGLGDKNIMLAYDFHAFLGDNISPANPVVVRKVKEVLARGKTANKVLVICGCELRLPRELEKELAVVEFKLPDKAQLRIVLEGIARSAGIELDGNTDAILDAAGGLTTTEAEDAFALSVVECGDIKPEIVAREKAMTIKKNGILEVVETKVTLNDIGGLEYYKEHLWSIRNNFTQAAKDYGLPSPRPVICVGQPGTGKSLSSMATAEIFNLPLLRLEAGKLFGSLVGQSESNWRSAFTTAKAIAPAILWVDEAEALFGGLQSSGSTDGGTGARVIKAILQDMQFNGEGLFFVFTSNDIDQFPDPLIDRCDVWSFDLPTATERQSIWKIHIGKRGRKPDNYDIVELASITEGYSGRQIEQIWVKALAVAFNDDKREPTMSDIRTCLKRFVPTSVTMKDAIERRRQRLANRAMAASAPEAAGIISTTRKLA